VSKLGFSRIAQSEAGHEWYELELPSGHRVRTKLSRHKREYGPKLEAAVARQLRVRHPFFMDIVSCLHTRDDYVQQAEQDPFPPWDVHVVA